MKEQRADNCAAIDQRMAMGRGKARFLPSTLRNLRGGSIKLRLLVVLWEDGIHFWHEVEETIVRIRIVKLWLTLIPIDM